MVLIFESLILPELVIRKNWEKCFANDFPNNFLKNCGEGATGFSSKFCILILLFPFICMLSLPTFMLLHLPCHALEQALYLNILYLKCPLFLFSMYIPVLLLPPHTECIQKQRDPWRKSSFYCFFFFFFVLVKFIVQGTLSN